jgi:hypothetical protein
MDERWLLPHTNDFYVRSEDIRNVTWEERPEPDANLFSVRITFVHPSIASKQFDDFTWSEIIAFTRRGVMVTKAAPSE